MRHMWTCMRPHFLMKGHQMVAVDDLTIKSLKWSGHRPTPKTLSFGYWRSQPRIGYDFASKNCHLRWSWHVLALALELAFARDGIMVCLIQVSSHFQVELGNSGGHNLRAVITVLNALGRGRKSDGRAFCSAV